VTVEALGVCIRFRQLGIFGFMYFGIAYAS
jgi:hypothetical protein